MRRALLAVLLSVGACGYLYAQAPTSTDIQFEYGHSHELKGVKTIFIDTRGDLELRDEIAARVGKATRHSIAGF